MKTERLYYSDSYLTNFTAQVVSTEGDGLRVYLDQSALYPASGGQLHDLGSIAGRTIREVVDEGERVAHILTEPLPAGIRQVEAAIDWRRRFDFMQQHTGQHLLSAVLAEEFGLETVSVHLGEESSTVEVAAGQVADTTLRMAERRANEMVTENRPVSVSFEDAAAATGLRKASDREGILRVVTIQGLDRSACGGTHVRATGEIGAILLRKIEKIRGNTRIEFVCGGRAVQRAARDYELLNAAGRMISMPAEQVPAQLANLQESAKENDKLVRKLQAELARYRGAALYAQASPGPDGIRRHHLDADGPLDEVTRTMAQAFTAGGQGMFIATFGGAILLAVSSDTGINAGAVLKPLLASAGGRGGGAATLAQGSIPEPEQMDRILQALGG